MKWSDVAEDFGGFDIDDAFEKFMRDVQPEVEPTSIQYRECRRVFYAGGWSLFVMMTYGVASLPDDVAEQRLQEIEKQIHHFFKERVGFNE